MKGDRRDARSAPFVPCFWGTCRAVFRRKCFFLTGSPTRFVAEIYYKRITKGRTQSQGDMMPPWLRAAVTDFPGGKIDMARGTEAPRPWFSILSRPDLEAGIDQPL